MIRLRSLKLLSGVSTLAVLAAFGAADPLLAAPGVDVNGPGNVAAQHPGGDIDYLDIDTNANVGTDGSGNSILNDSGDILGNAASTAVRINDSVLQGAITNNGSIGSTGADGVNIGDSIIEGGLFNNGLIGTVGDGIDLNGNTVFNGGISNTGTINAGSTGIYLNGSGVFTGGIVNSGRIIALNDGIGIGSGWAFSGGINNSGTIDAGTSGIYIDADSFLGGITNSGLITTAASTGIYWTGDSFAGGINNTSTGTINADTGYAIYLGGGTFTGGVTNAGQILAPSSTGLYLDADLFQGGINNTSTGTISSLNTGIGVYGDLFQGGITNAGQILSSSNYGIYIGNSSFQGGINNTATGTITAFNTGIYVSNDTFEGGITNAGLIQSTSSYGVYVGSSLFEGGLTNSGSILGGVTSYAVYLSATTFNGGITNSGLIQSDDYTALYLSNTTFNGGITNTGSIVSVTGGYGVYSSNTTFNGGINNSGLIQGGESYTALYINDTSFNGGITNSGLIASGSTNGYGIYINPTSFSGGINNSGTIIGVDTGIYVNSTTFDGGITNSGLIDATSTGAAIYLNSTSFTGGINNTATGEIGGYTYGVYVNSTTFSGGITNAGTIGDGATYAVYIDSGNTSFAGGINNSGTIISTSTAIYIGNSTFEGGITNSGLIQSTGSQDGIHIGNTTFAGGINNTATGVISGYTGIYVSNTTFTGGITNAGLIDGTTGYGIYVSNTTFTGGIDNSGTILAGDYYGIYVGSTTFEGGLDNSGLIDADSYGVYASVTNWTGGFNNSGVIQSADSTGVYVTASNWSGDFTNSGTILGGTTSLTGYGVYMSATNVSGDFDNSGLIQAGANGYTGVYLTGSLFSGDVTNSGTIIGTGAGYDGLSLNHTLYAGDVLNSGKITADQTGIYVGGSTTITGSLTNSGVIDPSYGIYVDGSIQGGIFNSGTILATVTAIDLSSALGTDLVDLTLGHTITQTGGLIQANSLTDGTGTVETALDLNQGLVDTFNGNGGTLDGDVVGDNTDFFAVGGNFVYLRGTASGIDTLDFNSGNGAFGVQDADLDGFDDITGLSPRSEVVDFTTVNDVNVNAGGTAYLGDQATIHAGDDLNVDADGRVAFFLTTDETTHGLIDVNDDANLDGTLHAVIDATSFASGTTDTYFYNDIITGSVSGSFSDVTTSSLFWTAEADYNANDVDLTLTRVDFGDVLNQLGLIQTQNQQSIGNVLEVIFEDVQANGPCGCEFDDLFVALFGTSDPAVILAMYDEINGSEHAQTQQSVLSVSGLFNTLVGEQLDSSLLTMDGVRFAGMGEQRYAQAAAIAASDASSGGYGSHGINRGPSGAGVWLRGFGQWTNTDTDPEAPGYDQDTSGLAGGVDFAINNNATLGAAAIYSTTDVDFDTAGDHSEFDSWQFGAYGNYGFGNFYAGGMASYAMHDVSTVRTILPPIPGAPFVATAGYDASAWSVAGEVGGIWRLGRVNVQPSAGLSYTGADTDGFIESCAPCAYDLAVQGGDADSFAGTLALRASGLWTMGRTRVVPDIKIGWRHEFDDDRETITAIFVGDPTQTPFTIVSSEIQQDSALVSAGLTAGLTNNLEVFVDVNGLYNSDSSSTNASGGVRLTW